MKRRALSDSDAAWRHIGANDPYFGVLTQERYRGSALAANEQREFFESGERYVEELLATIRERLRVTSDPRRVLDYGCGVGRLTIPFARRSTEVVGVDISPGMLEHAERNALEHNLANTAWVEADDGLTRIEGTFDLVHSFIVFQHIKPARGELILHRLIDVLRPDGVGAVHMTYAFGSETPLWKRFMIRALEGVPLANGLYNVVKHRPYREPRMQMNLYDVNRVLRLLHERGCQHVALSLSQTSHFGYPLYGVTFLFTKTSLPVGAHG